MSRHSDQVTRIRRMAVVYFSLTFLAMMWPIYPFFSGIYPRILGMPLSLTYIIGLLLLSFLVLWRLYAWESKRDRLE